MTPIDRQRTYAPRSARSLKLTERQLPPTYSSTKFGALHNRLHGKAFLSRDRHFRIKSLTDPVHVPAQLTGKSFRIQRKPHGQHTVEDRSSDRRTMESRPKCRQKTEPIAQSCAGTVGYRALAFGHREQVPTPWTPAERAPRPGVREAVLKGRQDSQGHIRRPARENGFPHPSPQPPTAGSDRCSGRAKPSLPTSLRHRLPLELV